MTDEAYCLRETEKERKTLARMSRYKKNGSRTHYVRLPQTYMTDKELAKMNGKIYTLSLSKPMDRKEFKALSDDLKREYILNLVNKHEARQGDIAHMLGYSTNGFWSLCKQLFTPKDYPFSRGRKNDVSPKWLEFIGTNEPNQSDSATDIIESTPVTCAEPKVEKKIDTPPKQTKAEFDSITLRFSGSPADMLAAAAKAAYMLDGNKSYHVCISIDQLVTVQPALSNF
jgi:hypothetical protein